MGLSESTSIFLRSAPFTLRGNPLRAGQEGQPPDGDGPFETGSLAAMIREDWWLDGWALMHTILFLLRKKHEIYQQCGRNTTSHYNCMGTQSLPLQRTSARPDFSTASCSRSGDELRQGCDNARCKHLTVLGKPND